MKILLCSPIPRVNPRLGASRVSTDFAEGLSEIGVSYEHYPRPEQSFTLWEYAKHLQEFLPTVEDQYDVIDYPFLAKPWIAPEAKTSRTLKVTRIMLLPHLEDFEPDPQPPKTLYRQLRNLARSVSGRANTRFYSPEVRRDMDANIRSAHLTTVANSADRACLIRLGFDAERIKVFPYGLTTSGAAAFDRMHAAPNKPARTPVVAFVGTFDYRKGCLDFPKIVARIAEAIPNVRFRLLGTKGMMPTSAKVYASFPRKLRPLIDVHPTFDPAELPQLLADCSAGIFPSYREGFGIAVVEMLAAGLPVFAYDVAGPCDILPAEWLINRGEHSELASKVIQTLQVNEDHWIDLSNKAIETSRRFQWRQIATDTVECYKHHLERLRSS